MNNKCRRRLFFKSADRFLPPYWAFYSLPSHIKFIYFYNIWREAIPQSWYSKTFPILN